MADTVFTFSCPCCNKRIEVDTRSGKARAVQPTEAKGGQDLDTLLRSQKKDQQRLEDLFSSAKDIEAKKAELLDAQLKKAKDEAKKDKDTRPRNIFDLD
jgi:predicted transposase YbfD/YdcC